MFHLPVAHSHLKFNFHVKFLESVEMLISGLNPQDSDLADETLLIIFICSKFTRFHASQLKCTHESPHSLFKRICESAGLWA